MRTLASSHACFVRSDAGANTLEYTLIMSLIAFAIAAGAGALGTGLNTFFSNTATGVSSVVLPSL